MVSKLRVFSINFKKNIQSTALVFCALVMAFTITQPAEVAALGFWKPEKGTNFADALAVV